MLASLAGKTAQFLLRGKVIAIATVVICAYFSAKIVSSLVEAEVLLPPANAAPAPAPRPAPATAVTPTIDANVISDRNIFCSDCEPERTSVGYRGEAVTLIATSVADSGRRATLRVISSNVQGSWGLDDTVPGVGKIVRIGGTSIDVVDDGNHQKTISLLDATGPGSGTAMHDPAPGAPPDPFEGRIKKISDTSFEVERDVVRELVGAGGTNAGARAIPVMDKGQVTGIRLLGVRPTSVAAKIGLKSNDVIQAIDNEPLKSAQSVLDLYAKLDKLSGVEVQGTRGGKPLAISLKFH